MALRSHFSSLGTRLGALGQRFFPRLTRAGRMRTARRTVQQLRPAIADNQRALLEFDECSSTEFTGLAESLAALDAGLAQVRTQAAQLDCILQDQDDDRALSSAFELFKKSVDLAHASIGIALSQEEQMEQLEDRLLENRDRFSQNSLMFRVLVMSIRTEAARIDPANRAIFAAVAGEIADMERQMNATVGTAFSQIEAIVREAAAGRAQLQGMQADLNSRAQHSITLLRTELESIKLKLEPCAAASRHIVELLAQTRTQTSDLITALQYQDIVRQQLEHVGQGFDDIARHLEPNKPGALATVDPGYLHHAARIQQKHLYSSRHAIEDASRQIGEGSSALLDNGAALVARFTEMETNAEAVFRESDVGELFKRETQNLVEVAGQSESTNQRISRLLERIEESVRVFSGEISRHALEVHLVALNGQIAAAQVPDAGALNKLAEETTRLSGATAQLSRSMGAQLGDTLTHLKDMRTEADEALKTVGRERADLAAGSEAVSGKLTRLNDRIHRSSGEVARSFGDAYQRVRDLLPTLRFPSLIAVSFEPCEQLCDRLLAATAAFAADEVAAEGSDRLAAHQRRYTMREERDAHTAAIGGKPLLAPRAVGAAVIESVELFDCPPAAKPVLAAAPVRASAAEPATSPATQDLGGGVELF